MLSSKNNPITTRRPLIAPRRIHTIEDEKKSRTICAASSTLPSRRGRPFIQSIVSNDQKTTFPKETKGKGSRERKIRNSDCPKEECMVCYEDIPTDSFVQCICKEKVCIGCTTTFIDKEKNPACVVCKGEFDEAFLHRIMDTRWMSNSYKPLLKERYYIQVMSDRETRMTEVENYDRSKELEAQAKVIKDEIAAIKGKIVEAKTRRTEAKNNDDDKAVEFYTQEIDALDRERKTKQLSLNRRRTDMVEVAPAIHHAKQDRKLGFACLCPYKDCRGMVDPKTHLCKICEQRTCIRCHEPNPKGSNPKHKCDENTVANVKQLREDTRSCPQCATPIFRMFGCDQMFCTQCKIYFNWRTGHIDTKGTYHNPEATRLAQELGVGANAFHTGNAQTVQAAPVEGGCPQGIQPIEFMKGTLEERSMVYHIFNVISEIPGSILPKYGYNMDESGFKSRVLLMKGIYDKKKFGDMYYRLDRERKRRANIHSNLQSLYQVASDNFNYFRDMVNKDPKNAEGYNNKAFIEHMNRIREEFNRILAEDVKVLGGTVAPYIPSDWSKWEVRNDKVEEGVVQYSKWLMSNLKDLMRLHNLKDTIPRSGKYRNHVKKDLVEYFEKTWPNGPPQDYSENKAIRDVSLMLPGYVPGGMPVAPVVQRVITMDDYEDPLNGMTFTDSDDDFNLSDSD